MELRNVLLSQLFYHEKTIPSLESTHPQERLYRTKVLIVLDDLDDAISQLNELLPKGYKFGAGSRIIVTTRDAQLVKSRTNRVYEVERLNDVEALKLFRLHAFENNCGLKGYEALSKNVADYAYGNPLGFEGLGSSLHSKSIEEWRENLVELVMPKSQLVELYWNEDQPIGKLKKINLSYSEGLIQIPNMSGAMNLQSIDLQGCTSLIQVPSYFKNLDKLQLLDLGCKYLKDGTENLPLHIRDLKLSGTAIEVLPSSFVCLLDLIYLDLGGCKDLKDGIENLPLKIRNLTLDGTAIEVLPLSFGCLLDLKFLSMSGCKNLKDGIENLPLNVKDLKLSGTAIEELPSSFWCLLNLGVLDLSGCKNLKNGIENLPLNIIILRLSETTIEALPSSFRRLLNIEYLDLVDSEIRKLYKTFRWHTRTNIIANRLRRKIPYIQDIACLDTVYPGDEIPEWFSHQIDYGNSLHFHLPPNWFHDINHPRFKFVYCIVLLNRTGQNAFLGFESKFKTNMNRDDRPYVYQAPLASLTLGTICPDHVFMCYWEIDLIRVFGAEWSCVHINVIEASCRAVIEGEGVINWETKKFRLELGNTWDTADKNKKRFGEFSGQPNAYQDKVVSRDPQINSKRIKASSND
ncbi:disease resistance-like protein DSC1 [Ziziphus jujuba]|uniref:ADP-ribosyl cyclase/cyclic ADP-ribose hydrolase n=1 Tax=Ziziphus jujuba TaxID=326968 RepID=A0ABM4AAS9_ZIZJJ|nr:disease resistance-like protein DSC1 [Ziziphus jujuba]